MAGYVPGANTRLVIRYRCYTAVCGYDMHIN